MESAQPPQQLSETGQRLSSQEDPTTNDSRFVLELEEGLQGQGINHAEKRHGLVQRKNKPQESNDPSDRRNLTPSTELDDDSHAGRSTTGGLWNSKCILTALIVTLGAVASAAFIAIGIHATHSDMDAQFTIAARGVSFRILSSWSTYETFALWIHSSCHKHVEPNEAIDPYQDIAGHLGYCSRQDFRRIYEHLLSRGVNFLSAQLLRNISHSVRDAFEAEGRAYYNTHYPHLNYTGITEVVVLSEKELFLQRRQDADFYMPVHYVEPVLGNEKAIDMDKLGAYNKQTSKHLTISSKAPQPFRCFTYHGSLQNFPQFFDCHGNRETPAE
jgi:hypothetical protein